MSSSDSTDPSLPEQREYVSDVLMPTYMIVNGKYVRQGAVNVPASPPAKKPDEIVYAKPLGPLTASALNKPCAMYTDHGSSVPVITQGHHVRPVYLQNRKYGKIVNNDLMYLCGTCHDSLHAWLYWLMGERDRPLVMPGHRIRLAALRSLTWYNGSD